MKKLFIIAGLLVAGTAYAQPESREGARAQAEAKESSDPTPEDPSAHFNFTNFDYRGKDELGGPFGDGQMVDAEGHVTHEEEPMSAPYVLLLGNFVLLLIILAKVNIPIFGFRFLRETAQTRHDDIKSALDEAAKLRDEAKKKLAEYEGRIKGVDDEIKKIVEGIKVDAEADKKRILEQAERQAEQMKKDAEQRIAAEIELARASLAKEVSTAAAKATEKILRDKTTPDDQNKLVTTFINGMGA